jgi:carbon storage regulator
MVATCSKKGSRRNVAGSIPSLFGWKGVLAMLVLTRKLGESIIVPDQGLTITVLGVTRNKVRLGFVGPANVAIHRQEVWERLNSLSEADGVAVADDSGLAVR